jgi:long-subunit acyl-CoA synthetase (AMP-forming)
LDDSTGLPNAVLAVELGPPWRLAVSAENSVETALAHLGGLLGSASTEPANFHVTAEEVAYILEDSGSQMLLVGPQTVETGLAADAYRRGHGDRMALPADAWSHGLEVVAERSVRG